MASKSKHVLDFPQMQTAASDAAALLRTLANADRLMLLCQLSLGEQSVGELEESVNLRQPSLSQQLGVLRSEGLVETRREGKRIFYSVQDPKVLQLLKTIYDLYCGEKK